MTTVAVVGAGDLGGAAAHALAMSQTVGRIVIIDASGRAAAGKALDIMQGGTIAGVHTELVGTDDPSRAAGCTVCLVADRFGGGSPEWTGDDGLAMLARLDPVLSGAPLVFTGVMQASLIEAAARELGIRRTRLIGSAPEAFASAARAMVAVEAGCSPDEVSLAVLGRPPGGLVVPWSHVSIGGYTLEHRLASAQVVRIESRVARVWPPGPFALGLAGARVTAAVVSAARRSWSVLTLLDGEYGVRRVVGIIPALLANSGIVRTWEPTLTTRERVRLVTALGEEPPQERRPA